MKWRLCLPIFRHVTISGYTQTNFTVSSETRIGCLFQKVGVLSILYFVLYPSLNITKYFQREIRLTMVKKVFNVPYSPKNVLCKKFLHIL